jgi:lipopolysaccharide export LptBFGC system permease protein LptF
MAEIFEALMVISFGISWPTSIVNSYKARTAKGKSLMFLCFILFGYVCGIISKLVSGKITYVFVFYVLNLIMVSFDLALYFRNKKLDEKAA